MILNLFAALCALLIYFGFAALLGALVRQLRLSPQRDTLIASLVFALLIFLPASLSLPLPAHWQWICWSVAAVLAMLFAIRPVSFPAWIWEVRTGLLYAAAVMLLVLVWSLAANPPVLAPLMDLLAAAAAGLAWKRSRMYTA